MKNKLGKGSLKKSISVLIAVITIISCMSQGLSSFAAELQTTEKIDRFATSASSNEDWSYYIDVDNNEAIIYDYLGSDTDVVIPDTIEGYPVTTIGATENRHNFTSVTIPDSITTINMSWAFFRWSTELTTINVSPNNNYYSSVDGVLFNKDKTVLLYYPMGKEETLYSVPDTVTSIGDEAFTQGLGSDYCYSLQNVTLPDGIESIGHRAFMNCYKLETIVISDSLASVESEAFRECYNLNDVYYMGSLTQWNAIEIDDYENGYLLNATLHTDYDPNAPVVEVLFEYSVLDENAKTAEITEYLGSDSEVVIPSTIDGYQITEIGRSSFALNETITSVVIPEGVKTIGDGAFAHCTNLAEITLPDSIERIENLLPDMYPSGAFCETAYVNNDANWIDGVCYIGNHVYAARSVNDAIKIKEGTLTIADYWYVAKKVYMPKSIRNIGDYAGFFDNLGDFSGSTIYGYKGTCAETFAIDREHPFVPREYTGLYKVAGVWKYVNNGELDNTYTGLCKYNNVWYYVENGVVDWDCTGAVKHTNNAWYYVENGKVVWSKTGLIKSQSGSWLYIKNGQVDFSKTGLVKHTNGVWYYVQNGRINFSKTGLVKHTNGVWYYVEGGQIKWSKTGLVKHTNGVWYYVQGGQIKWSKTGLVKHTNGVWYYVQGGQIKWSKTGLVKHTDGNLYYVKNGQINWGYTGYATYNGVKYKVVNGKV